MEGSSTGTVRYTMVLMPKKKEPIGGLFLVKAKDYDEAVEIAKGRPIIQYGAIVEARMSIPAAPHFRPLECLCSWQRHSFSIFERSYSDDKKKNGTDNNITVI